MKAYKGFNRNLACRGHWFELGESYDTGKPPVVCETGFHACLNPFDVLHYYSPINGARYCEVEVDDNAAAHHEDSKVASQNIEIGAEIGLAGLIHAGLKAVQEGAHKATPGQFTWGDEFSATASGRRSIAAAAGPSSSASTAGYQSVAATTGDQSSAAATGHMSVAVATGVQSSASTTGMRSVAATTGMQSVATATGEGANAIVTGPDSVAVAAGLDCSASGKLGCWLVLVERDYEGRIIDVRTVKVDGNRIKPDGRYFLSCGRVASV